jgi:hypothetical protein
MTRHLLTAVFTAVAAAAAALLTAHHYSQWQLLPYTGPFDGITLADNYRVWTPPPTHTNVRDATILYALTPLLLLLLALVTRARLWVVSAGAGLIVGGWLNSLLSLYWWPRLANLDELPTAMGRPVLVPGIPDYWQLGPARVNLGDLFIWLGLVLLAVALLRALRTNHRAPAGE